MKLILTMGAPWNVFKNLAENVLIPYTELFVVVLYKYKNSEITFTYI